MIRGYFSIFVDKIATSSRSKSVVILRKTSWHRRQAMPRNHVKKKRQLSRYSLFSLRYAGSKVLIFHRLVLACRTRTPMASARARIRRSYGPVEWRNLRSSAKRESREEENDDDDGETRWMEPVLDDDFDDLIETSSWH